MSAMRASAVAWIAAATFIAGCQTATTSDTAPTGTSAPPAAPASPPPPVRPPAAEPPAPAAAPEAPAANAAAAATMSTEEMQKRLTDLGYQPGPADGKAGPRTVNALKKFQHDHHLPVTGRLDAETAIRLQQGK